MGFLRDMFATAAEMGNLRRQCDFVLDQLEKEQWRTEKLEKALDAERKAKDKVLLRAADLGIKQRGLSPAFVSDAKDAEELKPDLLSPDKEEFVRELAQKMLDADEREEKPTYLLEEYMKIIRQDPDRYVIN